MGMNTNMKIAVCLALVMLVSLSYKAQADTLCMRECPPECINRNHDAREIECYFYCIINCEHCPDSPTGCPPNEETKKRLASAKMDGLERLMHDGKGVHGKH